MNNNNNNNNNPNPGKRKRQKQNPPRVEFGTEFDVNQVDEQNRNKKNQQNTPLDPRNNRF